MINIDRPLADNMKDERCLFKCDEPDGSMIAGILIMFLGIIIVPVIIQLIEGLVPLTLDNFLLAMFVELARILHYTLLPSTMELVFYMAFSLLAGVLTIKAWKGLAVPIIFAIIAFIGFFFLAFFYLGIPIDYNLLLSGALGFILTLSFALVIPCLGGVVISFVLVSKKKCFVIGKGTTVNQ